MGEWKNLERSTGASSKVGALRAVRVVRYPSGVSARTDKLLEEVLEPPEEEREAFAAKLLEKRGAPSDGRTDEAWARELERRVDEVRDPSWRGSTWDEARAEIERGLRRPQGG